MQEIPLNKGDHCGPVPVARIGSADPAARLPVGRALVELGAIGIDHRIVEKLAAFARHVRAHVPRIGAAEQRDLTHVVTMIAPVTGTSCTMVR